MADNRRARKARGKGVEARRETVSTYRGLTIEELRAKPLEEVLPLLPSRARRFVRRGLGDGHKLLLDKIVSGASPRTHLRDMPILPSMVDQEVHVHNGKEFVKVHISTEMIGHKLGEFALTRKAPKHTGPGVGATRSSKFMPLK